MIKICRLCKNEKDLEKDFHKKKTSKDGYRNECKECVKEIQKEYKECPSFIEKRKVYDKKRYIENREEILENKKIHHQKNKEEINAKKREYNKNPEVKEKKKEWWQKYRVKNDEKLKIYHRNYKKENTEKYYEYRRNNPHIIAWRSLLYSTLKRIGKKKESHTIDELGYSAEDLKIHIESKFTPGMSWDNHGEWHIDHIIPVSYFTKDVPVSLVCGLNNLQPLWSTTRDIDGVVYEGNLNESNN